jgi:hypothetical protein
MPFTLSEWNIPEPNDFGASVVPFAAMAAALQDWDGVFFFQYHPRHEEWDTDRIIRHFSFNGQPVKLALLTACANLYRRGDLKPLEKTAWGTALKPLPPVSALTYRIGTDVRAGRPAGVKTPAGKRVSSPNGAVVWDASKADAGHVSVNTPASRGVWGLIAGQDFDLGGLRLSVGPAFRNYAAIVVTSLDGKPLEGSARMLLAAVGSAHNKNMGWNKERTSVGDQWGEGPTQVNGIPAAISIKGGKLTVYPLDGRGKRMKEGVPVTVEGKEATFEIGPKYRTLWYEVVRAD